MTKTPLFIAVEKNNYDIVKLLLEREDTNVNVKMIMNSLF